MFSRCMLQSSYVQEKSKDKSFLLSYTNTSGCLLNDYDKIMIVYWQMTNSHGVDDEEISGQIVAQCLSKSSNRYPRKINLDAEKFDVSTQKLECVYIKATQRQQNSVGKGGKNNFRVIDLRRLEAYSQLMQGVYKLYIIGLH